MTGMTLKHCRDSSLRPSRSSMSSRRSIRGISSVTSEKKVVDVKKYYNTERLRPIYDFDGAPLFIMTSD